MLRLTRPRFRTLAWGGALLLSGLSCKENVFEPLTVASVEVVGGGASLRIGQGTQLGVMLKSSQGWTMPTVGVSWTSNDPTKVTVSTSGQVTALARGTVTLTASAGGVSGTTTVTVIGVQAVAIAPDSVGVIVTEQQTLAAVVTADSGVTVSPTWTVRDTLVATIESTGRVTARMVGATWAVAAAEVARDSVRVQVLPVPVVPPAAGSTTPVVTTVLGGAVALTIPPGATSAPALAVAPVTTAPTDDRLPKALAYTFGPAGTQFATPITVGLRFDPTTIPVRKRAALELRLLEGGAAVPVPGSAVDLAGNRVTAPVSHFSTYGIFVPSDPTQVGISAGGGQSQFVNYEVPLAPAVLVRDAQGRPVAGVLVRFDVSAGGGTLRGGLTTMRDTATTDAGGLATLRAPWRLGGTAGAQAITATAFRIGNDSTVASATITATALENPVARVVLTPGDTTLRVGTSLSYVVKVFDMRDTLLTGRTVTWATSDSTKATVSSTGLVTARVPGSATITASSEGKSAAATVTVQMPVATVEVTPATATLYPPAIATALNLPGAASQQLAATVKDAGGVVLAGRSVTWSSSDTTKARVSATGLVTTVAAGTVTITATSEGKSGSATLTIVIPVTTVEVAPATATLAVGATQQLTAVTKDATGQVLSGRTVTWATSDSTKATVSSTGLVTGVSTGSATITATSEGKSASSAVTVFSSTVPGTSNVFGYGVTTPAPAGGGGGTVAPVIPLTLGMMATWVEIAATGNASPDGPTVVPPDGFLGTSTDLAAIGPIAGFTGPNAFFLVGVFIPAGDLSGMTAPAKASYTTPSDYDQATYAPALRQPFFIGDGKRTTGQAQRFYIPDGAVALVLGFADGYDYKGLVGGYANNAGGLQVTASTKTAPVATIEVTPTSATLAVGATQQVTAVAKDASGTVLPNRPITWTSSNPAVATVSNVGLVTARAVGSATVTATSEGRSATSVIQVKLESGLLAYYPLDGNALDASGSGLNGTISGAIPTADRYGRANRAYRFNGGTNEIAIGDINLTGAYTLTGWFRRTSATTGGSAIVSRFFADNSKGWEFYTPLAGGCLVFHSRGTVGPAATCNQSIEAGRWYHAAVVFDGVSKGTIYLDGAVISEKAGMLPDLAFSGYPAKIGRTAWGSDALVGDIDEVRIYDRALTESEVTTLAADRPAVATVTLNPTSVTLLIGATQQMTATVKDAADQVLLGRTVMWSSSATAVATVSATGLITSIASGSTTITATSEGKSGTAAIVVQAPVHSIEIAPSPVSVALGTPQQLSVVLKDASGNVLSGRTVLWSSSNTGIVDVSAGGLVTANDAGIATVTATSEGRSATVQVTATGVALDVALSGPTGTGFYFLHVFGGSLSADRWERVVRTATTTTHRVLLPAPGTYQVRVYAIDARTDPLQTLGGWTRMLGATRQNAITLSEGVTRREIRAIGVSVESVVAPTNVAMFEPSDISWVVRDSSGLVFDFPTRHLNHATSTWPDVGCGETICGGLGPNPIIPAVTVVDGQRRSYAVSIPGQTTAGVRYWRVMHALETPVGRIALFSPSTVAGENLRELMVGASSTQLKVSVAANGLRAGTAILRISGDRLTAPVWTTTSFNSQGIATFLQGLPSAGTYNVMALGLDSRTNPSQTLGSWARLVGLRRLNGFGVVGLDTTRITIALDGVEVTDLSAPVEATVGTPIPISWTVTDTTGIINELFSREVNWGSEVWPDVGCNAYFCGGNGPNTVYAGSPVSLSNGRLRYTATIPAQSDPSSLFLKIKHMTALSLMDGNLGAIPAIFSPSTVNDEAPRIIKIVPAPVASITVSPTTTTLAIGLTQQLTATLKDGAGVTLTGRTVTWSSSDTSKATVSNTGLVTGRSAGSVAVTATSEGKTASAALTIFSPVIQKSTISAGVAHACGLSTTGAAYCWGRNSNGQLGDGTQIDRSIPTPVSGGLTFQAVAAGNSFTCGLTPSGTAYCWGWNELGQLGNGSLTSKLAPTAVSGGLIFKAIAAAEGGHTCGVTTAGAAYCWGDNSYGQFGDGGYTSTSSPKLVSGGLTFQAIGAGRNHTCGLATTGVAYCWGVNSDGNGTGRLGNGTRDDKAIPTAVSGGLTFQDITTAAFHTCGITTAGAAYCWGTNYHGEIGDGTRVDRWSPTAVLGGLAFKAITALGIHTCGLTTAGAAVCWGENAYGELGDGTAATAQLTPTVVSGGLTYQAITAGAGSTCGVTQAQAAYCWGVNSFGQLGDGSKSNRTAPTAVSGGLTLKIP